MIHFKKIHFLCSKPLPPQEIKPYDDENATNATLSSEQRADINNNNLNVNEPDSELDPSPNYIEYETNDQELNQLNVGRSLTVCLSNKNDHYFFLLNSFHKTLSSLT